MDQFTLARQEVKESKRFDAEAVERLDRPLFGGEGWGSKEAVHEEDTPQPRREWTEEEKKEKQLESGWSDAIMDAIYSQEEYAIYRNANLQEAQVGGRPCLIRDDIDMSRTDAMGNTNLERMERGLAPLTKDGKSIELHHIGQKADSPLAELTIEEHRGKGNDTILHDKSVVSEIDRIQFNREKAGHWNQRAAATNNEGAM